MHLVFERSRGRFKSNCNILALAWMPYYNETKFRQALFDYHQKQLINLTSAVARNQNLRPQNEQAAPLSQDGGGSSGGDAEQRNHNRTGSVSANQFDPKAQSNQFLNSRIAEFYQRYIYLNHLGRMASGGIGFAHETSVADRNGIDMCNELDSKYGRMPEFGWLVIGNVGKIVGVTLTSTIMPPEPSQSKYQFKNRVEHDSEDLMQFHETLPPSSSSLPQPTSSNQVSTANSNTAIEAKNELFETLRNAKPVQSTPASSSPSSEFDQTRPDRRSVRNNYNLRGHLDEVILVEWNELYQKLATIDSKGNVLIWCKINEKFTIQTPFYNRTKSVADFKWSNDGKTALICYTDSFILVGSSSGQRHWHSMLNLDDYHITCASWTPNDEQLLLGVSNGNVVVIDLPHSELTELVVSPTNIRAMCWSSCEMSLKNLSKLSSSSINDFEFRPQSNRRNSTVVNYRRLSRDCPVFSRYRFCSQGPNNNATNNGSNNRRGPIEQTCGNANEDIGGRLITSRSAQQTSCSDTKSEQRNLLAMDFANNTIKLYDGGLDDQNPRTIIVNLESYIMHWSSDGKILAVAGFNIHTSAPSVGCLRCRYLNAVKFYNQQGQLVNEHSMKYTRYPITAFTWAHADTRLFVATGPKLHCAKVFSGIPSLNLIAISCFQRYTRLPDKSDILESILSNNFDFNILNWRSRNCPIDLRKEFKQQINSSGDAKPLPDLDAQSTVLERLNFCNNSKVFSYKLPSKLQMKIDELFSQTIRQPYDEHWSLNDIIWHVPKNDQRHFCTLVCYTSDRDISSNGYQYRTEFIDRMSDNHATDQNKIFVLYVEFQGSLIPILRARRVGFLKPEFVIFDPEDNQLGPQRQRKISDVSHQSFDNSLLQRQFENQHSNNQQQSEKLSHLMQYNNSNTSSPFHYNGGFSENCSNLHLYSDPRASTSSMGRQSMSDAEHYYNFECDTVNRQNQDKMAELVNGRSHHQEPIALPMSSNPYLLYMMSMAGHHRQSQGKSSIVTGNLSSLSSGSNIRRSRDRYKLRRSGSLSENNELIRIKSNIWGTKFKLINVGNRMIKQRTILGSVVYKASILHLQPRQILLNIKDMSNYCCLCSRHHHSSQAHAKSHAANLSTGCNAQDNKVSILDMPNVDSPLITPVRHSNKKLSSSSKSRKSSARQDDSNKVVLPVGDNIRVAPKLDLNQQYRFARTFIVDNQMPSTSKDSGGAQGSSNSAYSGKHFSPFRNENSDRGRHRSRSSHSKSTSQPFVLQPDTYHSSETHSSTSGNCKSGLNETYHHQTETVRSKNGVVNNNDPQDDVLTLSLSQGDEVKIELSSLMDIRNDSYKEEHNNNRSQRLTDVSKRKKNDLSVGMDDFLATNKTLKSIQTITKMIVDLSSKAYDSGEDEEQNFGCGQEEEELSSPSKLVKLSSENSTISSMKARRYVPPDTPVHRPRRMVSRFSRDDAVLQTQSATSTPLKMFTSHKKHRRLDKGEKPYEIPPLPLPPPSVPVSRRLSSSAKRFFDGSLRSLYGGGSGSYLGSDLEPEENEPLITGRSPTRNVSKDVAWRLLGQSQPCTPVKSRNSSGQKQSSDLTSLKAQLVHRLRGNSNNNSNINGKSNSRGSNSNNNRTKSHFGSSNLLDKHSEVKTSSWNSRLLERGTSTSNFDNLVLSTGRNQTSDSNSDEEISNSESNDSEEFEHVKINSKEKNDKFNFSTSAKDLREFDPLKIGQDSRMGTRKRQMAVVSDSRRRRHRRKSICPNTTCCCAKEFKLNNRPPVWNELSQVYQLDFGGRVTQESAKNLQIDFDGNLALQFGRIDRCTYTLDYKYPFNAVQAMAIALASLTQRLK